MAHSASEGKNCEMSIHLQQKVDKRYCYDDDDDETKTTNFLLCLKENEQYT